MAQRVASVCTDVVVHCVAPQLSPFDAARLRACCKRYRSRMPDPLIKWQSYSANRKLSKAAKYGDIHACRRLVEEKGATYVDEALCEAAFGGHLHICQWAVEKSATDFDRALAWAAEAGNLDICRWAVEQGALAFDWALYVAAFGGHLHICLWAVEKGSTNLNEALRSAAIGGHLDICRWFVEEKGVTNFDEVLDWTYDVHILAYLEAALQ